MAINQASLGVYSIPKKKIPFTGYDVGWVFLCIGMAIGSGIIFMPVQIGLKGLWVFISAVALSYPAVYFLQNLFLRTLIQSEECENYVSTISHYLGKNWGVFLGVLYLIMLMAAIVTYATSITYDSASYLQSFGVTEGLLSEHTWYGLVLITALVVISSQGERVLFKVAGPMVAIKFGVVVALGVVMIPYWDFGNLHAVGEVGSFLVDVLVTLPFALFSILYVQILNPMNIAYRKLESDPVVAAYRSVRANRVAFIILAISVLFFAVSFSFSISKSQAEEAVLHNVSALAIVAKVMPGEWVKVMSLLLNVFAIMSAFFGVYLGFHEAVRGLLVNLLSRVLNEETIRGKALDYFAAAGIVAFLVWWVAANFSSMLILQLMVPIFGITACLVPCYLVFKVKSLANLKSPSNYYVAFYGVLLLASPMLKILE
ncbi:amino acid permease [Pseudomonas sichuanensis]|uniref:amino acid permease n=1 Tax=Pseudomonas sichuanensis TaxID=2213015 RepID=UPI00244794F1|nr:amino acid permease [Pseudomonas sichuanensis]MDH0729240.1 amino acid permease [Pseudomonas sichuanensis]MDH1581800.1 amino acid permease [Pseudomonas sichuanensis]MDH1592089.1 amino acid permease [Pseudomonas sichuanensis]MDH1597655.1 amino acid permease [Pseudomonas sichuanensis]